jgi:iron complex transport system ATP-binding protein
VHDLPRAAAWAERLVLLARGRVVAEGPPAEVLAGPAAAEAFEVVIRAEHLAGRPVYLFDEKPSPRG